MYKTQLARKLRADDQRNAALRTNDCFTDDDLNIKVRKLDETSKIVPRFTQSSSSKLKSNDGVSDTVDYIEKFVKENDIEQCGVWSVFGEPYNPRGAPDIELLRHAQKCKEERRKRRKTKKKTTDDKKKSKKKMHSMTWGGNRKLSKKSKKSSVTLDPNMTNKAFIPRDDFAVDPVLYKFPSEYIVESEKRFLMSKNGVPFGVQIENQRDKYGEIFDILSIQKNLKREDKSKKNPTMGSLLKDTSVKHSSRKSRTIKINDTHQKESDSKKTLVISGDEVNRWRQEFLKVRDIHQHMLQKELADNKLTRIEVYQSDECLANIEAIIEHHRKHQLAAKDCGDIWYEAKKISEFFNKVNNTAPSADKEHIESAKNLYHTLLLFVEYSFRPKTNFSPDVVDLVCYIKSLLENGLPANSNIFFECFRYTEQKVLECPERMQIFCFLRRYFNIKEEIVKNFMFKMGWHISSSKINSLMTDCNSFFMQMDDD